jgi:hypothetical protein
MLPVVLDGCETLPLTLRSENKIEVVQEQVLLNETESLDGESRLLRQLA